MTDIKDGDKAKFTITNWIATIAIVATFAVACVNGLVTYNTSIAVRALQARDAELKAFEDAAKQLQEAGAAYVKALNKGADLSQAREQISAILARQSIAAINLKPKLKPADLAYIDQYIEALREFNTVSREVSKPSDFRLWAESFGRTVDAASNLAQAVSANVGRS